jgi:predicted DCC family thiol-disulfide oxidoreductase YuxK
LTAAHCGVESGESQPGAPLSETADPIPKAPAVPTFDGRHPLIVFDGICVLCSGFAKFVVRFDRGRKFRFTTAQSQLGEALYRQHGLRTDVYETNLVIIDGVAHLRLDSMIAVLAELGWPWRAARLLRLIPRPVRDRLYGLIARNRYALFGKKANCDIPSAALRERIVG